MKASEQLKQTLFSLDNIEVSEEDSVFALLAISDLLENIIKLEKKREDERGEMKERLKDSYSDCLKVVLKKLKDDPDYFRAYKANISMDILDSFALHNTHLPQTQQIVNEGVENFLNRWIGK